MATFAKPWVTFEVGQNGCISGKTILYEKIHTPVRGGAVRHRKITHGRHENPG